MPLSVRTLMKETAAAFAVLSIYVLTLLAPLHQAAATQRGFAELGYETIGAWSLCISNSEADNSTETPTAVKCPVTGIGKKDLAFGFRLPATFNAPDVATAVAYSDLSKAFVAPHIGLRPHSRAPPITA